MTVTPTITTSGSTHPKIYWDNIMYSIMGNMQERSWYCQWLGTGMTAPQTSNTVIVPSATPWMDVLGAL
ncbi:hypothetical protein Pcinc_025251 [Petrolisthes cinctipes]|uniref:Uncharacterized protein n=1 Tax=Petrolisthes cinctipes TaxID=88211 RepID=A0AAE1FAZ2_PETCI|nr:hypothetical protein Pcinc_025251 [Petrolisthes cinctipes]